MPHDGGSTAGGHLDVHLRRPRFFLYGRAGDEGHRFFHRIVAPRIWSDHTPRTRHHREHDCYYNFADGYTTWDLANYVTDPGSQFSVTTNGSGDIVSLFLNITTVRLKVEQNQLVQISD